MSDKQSWVEDNYVHADSILRQRMIYVKSQTNKYRSESAFNYLVKHYQLAIIKNMYTDICSTDSICKHYESKLFQLYPTYDKQEE